MVNDKDFLLILFVVVPEYVVLVLLLVFRQILIIVVVNRHLFYSMNYTINQPHPLDLFRFKQNPYLIIIEYFMLPYNDKGLLPWTMGGKIKRCSGGRFGPIDLK
jgi:hypothetical protein